MWDALRLGESAAEPAGMAGVLEQQVAADQKRHDVGNGVESQVDDRMRGSDDKEDEGDGQLQITYRSMDLVSILKRSSPSQKLE